MRFLVESPHPGFSPSKYSRARDDKRSAHAGMSEELPFVLDVEERPEVRTEKYRSDCQCAIVYRVSVDGFRWLKRMELVRRGLSENKRPCVCACVGRLIEDTAEVAA